MEENNIIGNGPKSIVRSDCDGVNSSIKGEIAESLEFVTDDMIENAVEKREEKIKNGEYALEKFVKYPGFDNETPMRQVEIFTELMKSLNLLSISEDEDFYSIEVIIPKKKPIRLLCGKSAVETKFDGNKSEILSNEKDRYSYYHGDSELIKNCDEKASGLGYKRVFIDDTPEILKDLFNLFGKLGVPNDPNRDSVTFFVRFMECITGYKEFWFGDVVGFGEFSIEGVEVDNTECSNCYCTCFSNSRYKGYAYKGWAREPGHLVYVSQG